MKILKRGVIIVVVTALLVVSPAGSYLSGERAGKAYAGEVAATYTIYQALMALLGAFGITYVTSDMISSGWTDGSSALDPVYDDWKKAYDAERFKVIEGGGGSGSGPDLPPTFDALISGIVTKGVVDLTQDVWDCLKTWVTDTVQTSYEMGHNIYKKFHTDVGNIAMPENTYGVFVASREFTRADGSKYWDLSQYGNVVVASSSVPVCFYINDLGRLCFVYFNDDKKDYIKTFCYLDSKLRFSFDNTNGISFGSVKSYNFFEYSSSKLYVSQFSCDIANSSFLKPFKYSGDLESDAREMARYLSSNRSSAKYNQDTIWTSPEYEDAYRGTSPLELPNPPASPYSMPTQSQIQKLIEGVGDAKTEVDSNVRDDKSSKAVKDFISDMGIDFSVDPIPTPDPDPGPDPGPGPDPTPPTPDGAGGFMADLKTIFPFCMPFDLIDAVKVFNKQAKAPRWEIPLNIPQLGIKHTFVLDMGHFEQLAVIFRTCETIAFLIGLIILTRNIIKG